MTQTAATTPPAAADNREAILAAALAEFGAQGYKGATIKGIAARAGISPALVYWYYRDKEDLFRAVVARIADQVLAAPGFSANSHEDPAAVLTRFVTAYLTIVNRPEVGAFMRLVVSGVGSSPDLGAVVRSAGPGRVIERLTAYLEAQSAAGRLKLDHPAVAARMIMGSLGAMVVAVRLFGLPPTGDERPEVLVPLLLRMLGTTPIVEEEPAGSSAAAASTPVEARPEEE